jgi:hypothetical protein
MLHMSFKNLTELKKTLEAGSKVIVTNKALHKVESRTVLFMTDDFLVTGIKVEDGVDNDIIPRQVYELNGQKYYCYWEQLPKAKNISFDGNTVSLFATTTDEQPWLVLDFVPAKIAVTQ